MEQYLWLLLALVACQQLAAQPATAPAMVYTSGDRKQPGLHDTLHVGNGAVLYLKPGSKHDFDGFRGIQPFQQESYYLKQEKPGTVQRSGYTLRLQPN